MPDICRKGLYPLMSSYLFFILLLPLIGLIGLFSFANKANKLAGWIGTIFTLIGLCVSIFVFMHSLHQSEVFEWEWLVLRQKSINLSILLNNQTIIMLLVVHFIALLVQVFSISYLHHEPHLWRYFAYLQLFVFSMLGIVVAGNLLLMYIFWELVGLSSYLLIGFWYQKPRAVWAAKKAFLLNRIGDAGFLIGILLLFFEANSTDFVSLSTGQLPHLNEGLMTAIGLFLFCGVMGKSAQFPLSAWLPDAMEGPTPVSALIHAATMVAAGIFLLGRIHFLLTPDALYVITIIGTITMVMGAYRAISQTDIKKMLAYSTVSQLGLMVMGMGVGAKEAALFHLLTHAFFKAGLFLCAGAVIHFLTPHDENHAQGIDPQDMRQMGGLYKYMPTTFRAYTLCAAALAGLPLFSGFLSKDAILIEAFHWGSQQGGVAFLVPMLGLFSAGLTAFYTMKQWKMVFLGEFKGDKHTISQTHEADILMKAPLVILASLSVFIWFSFNPLDAGDAWFFELFKTKPAEGSHLVIAVLSVLVAMLGLSMSYFDTLSPSKVGLIPSLSLGMEDVGNLIKSFLQRLKWLREHSHDSDKHLFLIAPLQKIAQWCYWLDQKIVDKIVDWVGYLTVILAHIVGRFDRMVVDGVVNGMAWTAGFVGNRTRSIQNGKAQSYLVAMLVGVLIIIFFVL